MIYENLHIEVKRVQGTPIGDLLICFSTQIQSQNIMKIFEFQGSDIVDTPDSPGIYAWYYRPRAFGRGTKNVAEIMGKLITNPTSVKTEIALRYGLTWSVDSNVDILYSSTQKHQLALETVSDAVVNGSGLLKSFLQNLMVPYFAKPLYIGAAYQSLRSRIKKHYDTLTRLWDSNAAVSKYLMSHPNASVEEVLENLDYTHSFAVEARVKGIAAVDLVVCVYHIDSLNNTGELRELERILQILADPICGRR